MQAIHFVHREMIKLDFYRRYPLWTIEQGWVGLATLAILKQYLNLVAVKLLVYPIVVDSSTKNVHLITSCVKSGLGSLRVTLFGRVKRRLLLTITHFILGLQEDTEGIFQEDGLKDGISRSAEIARNQSFS